MARGNRSSHDFDFRDLFRRIHATKRMLALLWRALFREFLLREPPSASLAFVIDLGRRIELESAPGHGDHLPQPMVAADGVLARWLVSECPLFPRRHPAAFVGDVELGDESFAGIGFAAEAMDASVVVPPGKKRFAIRARRRAGRAAFRIRACLICRIRRRVFLSSFIFSGSKFFK